MLAAIAIVALTLVLLLLFDATRFRRPETWAPARPLVLFGGIAVAVVSVAAPGGQRDRDAQLRRRARLLQSRRRPRAHQGHGEHGRASTSTCSRGWRSRRAMIATMINALRVGLLPRWMGVLGIFSGAVDLPADRRRRAAGGSGVLAGDDGHPLRRANGRTASRRRGRPARRGRGRSASTAREPRRRAATWRRPSPPAPAGAGAVPRASAGASAAPAAERVRRAATVARARSRGARVESWPTRIASSTDGRGRSTASSPALLEVERFDPPAEFREQRAAERPRGLRAGGRRPAGVVGRAGRASCDWFDVDEGARRRRPAVLQVVHRRHAERLLQLPRPPRRRRPRRARRVSLARRGGAGARHHLRRAARRGRALRERAEGSGRERGRRRRDLPADDPRGRRRDARVRAHRSSPQRRLRRLLGGGGARAHGVLRGEGADHRRRRRAQGQDRRRSRIASTR